MPLSSDLIAQFVKITKDETKTKPETSVYGTVVEQGDSTYVRFDGSDLVTPVSKTADAKDGDRVTVMIKNHTAIITGNLSSPAARIADLLKAGADIEAFEVLLAGTATVKELDAVEARVDTLEANSLTADQIEAVEAVIDKLDVGIATVKDLSVVEARVEVLETDMLTAENADLRYAKIDDMDAANAEIDTLSGTFAEFQTAVAKDFEAVNADIKNLDARYATIVALDAAKARITDLEANVGDIDTLIFGSATGTTIQTSFANAVIAKLGNAQIKSAMIESVSADKITAGDIITNNVRVKSEDGSLIISDETMQISDGTRVRVQIGKDAASDYSINIWDESGNLMFSKGGITDSAIKDAIIRNDMVSDTANIAAHKLDIDSLFEEINGSTNTIKSTRVYLDENKQTLDVAFKSLSTTVNSQGETISSQGTAISTIQGQISSKIWQQDIDSTVNALEIGGRNLYVIKNSVEGFLQTGGAHLGAMHSLRNEHTSEYLVVEEGEEYVFQVWVTVDESDTEDPNLWMAYDFFDADKIAIGTRPSKRSLVQLPNGQCYDILRITVPADTSYMRVSARFYSDGKLKLERGNMPTDWTIAPEDIEGDITILSSRYSTIEQTIDSISATVAENTSKIESKANNSTVTEISNKVTTLEQNLDGFKTVVSDTYATKTELTDLVEPLESRVATAETTITQHATAISLRATQAEVETAKSEAISSANSNTSTLLKNYSTTSQMNAAIDLSATNIKSLVSSTYATIDSVNSVKIGGRNLYIVKDSVSGYLASSGEGGISGAGPVTNERTSDFIPVTFGEELRFQVWATVPDDSYIWYGYQFFNEDKTVLSTDRPALHLYDMKGGLCHAMFDLITVPEGAAYIRVSARMFEDGRIKVERGNKPTDWTPAPEDMATAETVSAIDTRLISAESTITQLSDKITANVTETTNLGTRMSTVEQTASGLDVRLTSVQTTANTARTEASNAAKTATNYLGLSDNGLVVGDLTTSTLGKNVRIDSDSVDIRSGNTVLASFGASTITLGQNSANSVINLCDGAGTIRALTSGASTSYPAYDSIEIASQEINTSSQRFVTDVTNSYGVTTTPTIQNDAQIYMLSNKSDAGSFARMEAMCTTTSSGAEMSAGASAIVYDTYSKTRMLIYAHDSTDTLNRSNQVNVYPHKTTFSQPLYRYITGHEYAIFDESMDTGWIDVTTLGSDFVVYGTDVNSKVRYRKRGKFVEVRGCVKPTSAIAGGTDNYTIFTLPSGYRPDSQVYVRCQGSGSYSWLLSITNSGAVRFARYNDGSQYAATSTSSWLPFHATFLVN